MPSAHGHPPIQGHAYAPNPGAPVEHARHGYRPVEHQPQMRPQTRPQAQHHAPHPQQQRLQRSQQPRATAAVRPPHRSAPAPQERGLTAMLMTGLLSLSVLAGVSITGLYMLNNGQEIPGLTAPTKQSSQEFAPLSDRAPLDALRQSAQKISKLEALNHSMMLELQHLRQKNRDMSQSIADLKSLYSQARIGNSWTLAQLDMKQAEPIYPAGLAVDPSLYLSVPLETGSIAIASNLPAIGVTPESELAFREKVETLAPSLKPDAPKLALTDALPGAQTQTPATVDVRKVDAREADASEANASVALKPTKVETVPIKVAALAPSDPIAVQGEENKQTLLHELPKARPANLSEAVDNKVASIAPPAGFEADPQPQPVGPISGNSNRFLAKMRALKAGSLNQPITILHVGDSHIASDSFTRGIRRRLQAMYGDAGRGAVIPAKAYKWAHADGLKLSAGRGWSSANSLKTKSGPYGLSGVRVSSSSPGAKMTLTSQKGAFDWATVTLYVGPGQGSATIRTDGGSKKVSARASKPGSKLVRIDGRSSSLSVTHNGGGKTTILNWATGKDKPGIQYVNFGIAGATVAVTNRWSDGLLANDIKRLDPDLIIYGYGTNEGYNDNLNMASYRRMAGGLVDKMQDAAPNAAMMFIGPADGARRRSSKLSCGGGWYTPNKLPAVRNTLKDMAKDYSGFYWDWSSAMGGRCGVTRWAGQKLAAKDRVHLTGKGYDRSAAAFVDYLERTIKNSLKIASN
ncbi:hypothetical protein FDK21_14340 [Cohaesibacter sp. CAU 1516]|nr:hypothetical protein FDK21_14340 [Cohaesibacter sp. CAU 1516]